MVCALRRKLLTTSVIFFSNSDDSCFTTDVTRTLPINRKKSWLTTIITCDMDTFQPLADHFDRWAPCISYAQKCDTWAALRDAREAFEQPEEWIFQETSRKIRVSHFFARPRDANWDDQAICFKNWSFCADHRHLRGGHSTTSEASCDGNTWNYEKSVLQYIEHGKLRISLPFFFSLKLLSQSRRVLT